ncbi:hypothetical protein N431DRAFT_344135 [Stipitochalara longipes BDJ]|nr:hypothetical protein N431DRAFT_344135 [Stipitochalara longipes BDJ]
MCKSSADIKRVAESLLLVNPPSSPEFESRKRKVDDLNENVLVPKYDTCVHCDGEFDVSLNEGEACSWHTAGEKQMLEDASIWDDYEDDREGQAMYDTAGISDYAEGWQWTCCDRLGNEEGCVRGPHSGKQYLGLTFATTRDDPVLPAPKHQKMEVLEPEQKFGNSVADLLDQNGGATSVIQKQVVQSKAPEIITVLDSSGSEAESEDEDDEEDLEDIETCTFCGQEYNRNDGDQDCLSHDEGLEIVEDCPLSEAERKELDEEKNPEWFVWGCCGESADSPGCRQNSYHNPDRGLGY